MPGVPVRILHGEQFRYIQYILDLLETFPQWLTVESSKHGYPSETYFRIYCRDNDTRTALKQHLILTSKARIVEDETVTSCKLCTSGFPVRVYGFRHCPAHGDEHGIGIDRLCLEVIPEEIAEYRPGFLGV
jgi:hypothetical protein